MNVDLEKVGLISIQNQRFSRINYTEKEYV
jgi:hypothetical protein